MKKFIFIFNFIILCLALVGCSSNSTINNTTVNNSTVNNSVVNNSTVNNSVSNTNTNNTNSSNENSAYTAEQLNVQYKEEVISSFSTNILDKDSNRQTNINLTCSSLSGTIVKPGETFSFCDTVGKATADRGYKEAKVFDADGNVTMGYGGGNCQVSSTLYNAVLQNSNFEIVERHPHSHTVYYVEKDKDAAVACGSVDFKFKNNNNYSIRIDASSDGNQVNISIVKI